MFNVRNPAFVARRRIRLGESFEPQGQEGEGLGLAVTPLAVPGKVALYLEDSQAGGDNFGTVAEDTIALHIETLRHHGGGGKSVSDVTGCAATPPAPREELGAGAPIMRAATQWQQDES